jgi:hypothetical protein
MKKVTSALALAALIAVPAVHAQSKIEVTGDFDARGWVLDRDLAGQDAQSNIDHRIRVGTNFTTADGVKVITRLQLANSNYRGDLRGATTSANGEDGNTGVNAPYNLGRGSEYVGFDLGYVDVPAGPGVLRVGRIETSWNNNFTAADDRRDRIQYNTRIAGHTAFAFMDRRVGVVGGADTTRLFAEGRNGYYIGSVGRMGPALVGLLLGTYDGDNADALDGAVHFAPYAQFKLGDVAVATGLNIWNGGNVLWPDTHYSGYLRGTLDLAGVKLEAQYAGVFDGGQVAGGFDTFSSLINNNPDHNRNPLNVMNIGGGGTDVDRHLLALRGTFDAGPAKISLAGGWVNFDNSGVGGLDEDVLFAELRATMQLRASTSLTGTVSWADADDAFANLGSVTAGMLALRTTF